jgi:hypothetical protein
MAAVFLDISKAFDTIPHAVIPDALTRNGLPEHFIRLVNNSYKSMYTTIKQERMKYRSQLEEELNKETPCLLLSIIVSLNHY